MNAMPTAAAAGKIDVGGDLTVNRLGSRRRHRRPRLRAPRRQDPHRPPALDLDRLWTIDDIRAIGFEVKDPLA